MPNTNILLVGDDRGSVISLKLSPNLRKIAKAIDGEGEGLEALWNKIGEGSPQGGPGGRGSGKPKTQCELEEAKLEQILQIALKGEAQAEAMAVKSSGGQ